MAESLVFRMEVQLDCIPQNQFQITKSFYPAVARRKLGITDEDRECIVEFFRWHIEQRNRLMDRRRIISILKLRPEQLINQKKSELIRELEVLQKFSK